MIIAEGKGVIVVSMLETYLLALRDRRHVGVAETSSYGALERLFEEVGRQLSPRVRFVLHPRRGAAGIPDGGFFTADQLRDTPVTEAFARQMPARGAAEIKPVSEPVEAIARTDQVQGYLREYGLVLVTNYLEGP